MATGGPTRLERQGARHGWTPPLGGACRSARPGGRAPRPRGSRPRRRGGPCRRRCRRARAGRPTGAMRPWRSRSLDSALADDEAAHVPRGLVERAHVAERPLDRARPTRAVGTTTRQSSIHHPTVAPPAKASRSRAGMAIRNRLSRLHSYVPLSSRRCISPRYPTFPHMAIRRPPHGDRVPPRAPRCNAGAQVGHPAPRRCMRSLRRTLVRVRGTNYSSPHARHRPPPQRRPRSPPPRARPRLRAVAERPRRRRAPQAATVALYALGLDARLPARGRSPPPPAGRRS